MVIGHFGFGLGAKKYAPKLSLGTLFLAVQFADILWPILLLLNIEHVGLRPGDPKFPFDFTDYPITHSLLMALLAGLLFGGVYWMIKKDLRTALVLGICVLSHWVLDLVVHAPDLPLYPGNSPKVGLGLWNWPGLTALVEGVLFIIGFTMYYTTTRAKSPAGKWGLWLLVVLLVIGHLLGLFSPLPDSVRALGWAAQIQWIYILLAYWVDHNRVAIEIN
jgi:hypothetical protein